MLRFWHYSMWCLSLNPPQVHFSFVLHCNVSLGQKWKTWRQEMPCGKSQCSVQFSAFWLINYCVFSVLWHATQFVHAAVMIGCPELIIRSPLFRLLSLLGKSKEFLSLCQFFFMFYHKWRKLLVLRVITLRVITLRGNPREEKIISALCSDRLSCASQENS